MLAVCSAGLGGRGPCRRARRPATASGSRCPVAARAASRTSACSRCWRKCGLPIPLRHRHQHGGRSSAEPSPPEGRRPRWRSSSLRPTGQRSSASAAAQGDCRPAQDRRLQDAGRLEFGVTDDGLAAAQGVIAGVSIEGVLPRPGDTAFGITDSAGLPVPFRAMATDIETGEAVVLDHGSMARTMRASMSVPGRSRQSRSTGGMWYDAGSQQTCRIDEARGCAPMSSSPSTLTAPLGSGDESPRRCPFVGNSSISSASRRSTSSLRRMSANDVAHRARPGRHLGEQVVRSLGRGRSGSARQRPRRNGRLAKRYSCRRSSTRPLRATQVAEGKALGSNEEIRVEGLGQAHQPGGCLLALVESKPRRAAVGGKDRRRPGGASTDAADLRGHQLPPRAAATPAPRAMVIEPKEKSWGRIT